VKVRRCLHWEELRRLGARGVRGSAE
jgi:hypothetical protein